MATPDSHEGRSITVMGHGRAEAAPDEAEVALGVEIVRPTAGEARAHAAEVMERVMAALRAAGIDAGDVQTADLSLAAEVEYRPDGPPRRTGFRLTNRVHVRVARPDDVPRVVDGAVDAGATSLDGVRFGLRDEGAARRAALGSACEDARASAESVATAAGVRLGAIRWVREAAGGGFPPVPRLAKMELAAADTPVAPGTARIEASVEVCWDLESDLG
jgi:uncharacterized protein YggE